MKPQSLKLTNYRAFETADLDLSAVEAAAIVGPNGAGKSTIPEAMLFALFGETRSSDVDGPVRLGAQEASVEFDFTLDGIGRRVIRKRSKGKRSSLDYLIANGGDWMQLTGASIAETQSAIERDLGMSKGLFLASSCVMQGQSAGICEAGPADRKKVLMEILADRLSKCGPLSDMAKLQVKRLDEELAAARAERARLEAVASERDATALQRGMLDNDLAEARQTIAGLEQELGILDQRVAEDKARLDKIVSLKAEISKLDTEILGFAQVTSEQNRRIGECEVLLESADDVRAKCEELTQTEAALAGFREAKDRYTELGRQYQVKEAELKAEGERLGAEEKRLQDRIDAAKIRLTSAAQRHSLVNEVPCKDSPMAGECKLLANARAAGEEIEQIEAEVAGYELQAAEISNAIKAQAARYVTELDPIKAEAKAVNYDREAHQLLESKTADLASYRDLLPKIEGAAATKQAATEALDRADAQASEKVAAVAALRADLAGLETADTTPWQQLRDATASSLRGQRTEAEDLTRRIGSLDERAKQMDQAEVRISDIDRDSAAAEHRRTLFATLQQAFGRDGIPALVIDHAIPQIEEMANDILGRLSAGRMNVRFATQKATKTAGVAETLDIIISDLAGERPYEDYSGGERLRVDLAVRIALGRMLAARTGAKIETLVLDEVCAPLDEAGEEALIDCVNRLRESFDCILLITHRESLRDRLPQQINVYANGAGSAVSMSV